MTDPVPETTETYNKIADSYVQNYIDRSPWQELYDQFLSRLNGKTVLDVGSGPGHDAKIFTEAGLEVTGIDVSDELLKHSRRKAPAAKFLPMDVRALRLPDKSFDGVWALASLQHLPKNDLPKALKEIKNVIKDDGVFYLSVTNGEGEGFVSKDRYDGNRKYFSNYAQGEITAMLEKAGFEVELFLKEERQDKFWNIFARPGTAHADPVA